MGYGNGNENEIENEVYAYGRLRGDRCYMMNCCDCASSMTLSLSIPSREMLVARTF
jgi:hypothetical protein